MKRPSRTGPARNLCVDLPGCKGKLTTGATGHVVAPGFIDTHYYSIDGLSMKMAARDGVTTGMVRLPALLVAAGVPADLLPALRCFRWMLADDLSPEVGG